MSKKTSAAGLAAKIPALIRELLGPPPIVWSESETVYWGMIGSFMDTVQADDIVGWFLVKDWVDARIEVGRYRKFKNELINEPRRELIQRQIHAWKKGVETDALAVDAEVEKVIDAAIEVAKQAGKTEDELEAITEKICEENCHRAEAAEQAALEQVALWESTTTDERDIAVLFKQWIGNVQRIDPLLIQAEERAAIAQSELHAHLYARAYTGPDDVGEPVDLVSVPLRSSPRRRLTIVRTTPLARLTAPSPKPKKRNGCG